jgi:hypothetical protein
VIKKSIIAIKFFFAEFIKINVNKIGKIILVKNEKYLKDQNKKNKKGIRFYLFFATVCDGSEGNGY